jgi:hypothetical protein
MGGGPIIELREGEAFLIGIHSFGHKRTGDKGGIKLTKTIKSRYN